MENIRWRIYEDGRVYPVINGVFQESKEFDGLMFPTKSGDWMSVVSGSKPLEKLTDNKHPIMLDAESNYYYVEWENEEFLDPLFFEGIFGEDFK